MPPIFPPSTGSAVKSVDEEAAEVASAPSKPVPGEVNGFTSATIPPAVPKPEQEPAAAPASTLLGEALQAQQPAVPQDGALPQESSAAALQQPTPQVEAERPTSPPSNGYSTGSADTSAISPSSFSDLDLLEAVTEVSSSPGERKDISVNVQVEESPSDKDNETQSSESHIKGVGKDESSDRISHPTETEGEKEGGGKQDSISDKMLGQDEITSCKPSDPKSTGTTPSEDDQGWDVPDAVKSDDLPSVSEAEPSSLQSEPKKRQSFLKRNKRKSSQGNPSTGLNKAHVWKSSFLTCPGGKFLCFLFLFNLMFLYFMFELL